MKSLEELLSNKVPDTMNRKENIIILPNNTLRFIDFSIQFDIYKAANIEIKANEFDELLYRTVCRKEKDLAKLNNIDADILKKLIKKKYLQYYLYAPRTNLYDILGILHNQRFVNSIKILFDNEMVEEATSIGISEYYDGTYDSLVEYLIKSKFTFLILDDIELLNKLTLDPRLDFNYKTVLVSRLGYNYTETKTGLDLKYFDDITSKTFIELYTFYLFDFDIEKEDTENARN